MHLTARKPRIMILGRIRQEAILYLNKIIKDEDIVRKAINEMETKDAIYLIKSYSSIQGVRGYRYLKEVRLVGTLGFKDLNSDELTILAISTGHDYKRITQEKEVSNIE